MKNRLSQLMLRYSIMKSSEIDDKLLWGGTLGTYRRGITRSFAKLPVYQESY